MLLLALVIKDHVLRSFWVGVDDARLLERDIMILLGWLRGW